MDASLGDVRGRFNHAPLRRRRRGAHQREVKRKDRPWPVALRGELERCGAHEIEKPIAQRQTEASPRLDPLLKGLKDALNAVCRDAASCIFVNFSCIFWNFSCIFWKFPVFFRTFLYLWEVLLCLWELFLQKP